MSFPQDDHFPGDPEWGEAQHQATLKLLYPLYADPSQTISYPATGPDQLNVTREITLTLARLAVLLEWQKARVEQMELGIDYTMVNRWVRGTAAEVEGLGLSHLGIVRVLTKRGY